MTHRESYDTPFDLCEPLNRTESTSVSRNYTAQVISFSFDRCDIIFLTKDNNTNIFRRELHGAIKEIRFFMKKIMINGLIKLLTGAIFDLASFDTAFHVKILR